MDISIKDHANLLILLVRLFDASIIMVSGIVSFFALESIKNFPTYNGFMPESYLTIIMLGLIFSLWWFPFFTVYKSWREASLFAEIRTVFIAWSGALLGLLAFLFFTKTSTEFSRHWFLVWFLSTFILMVTFRFILRWILRELRKKGFNLRHIVIVGGSELGQQVSNKLHLANWMGLKIRGIFSDTPPISDKIVWLGKLNDVVTYVERHQIDQVWIALPLKEMDQIDTLCRKLHSVVAEVKLVPDISSLRLLNYSTTQIDGLPVINMSVSPMTYGNRLIKFVEDKVLALIILCMISPLLCLIALAVKITSPGPIFYRQERIGNNGKVFQMLKFRSMPVNTNKNVQWGNAQNKQKTKIGVFLRKTSLDELPQFINVLKGDMSIVGPRPEQTVFVEQFKHEINSYMQKHLVPAGITGWAQINGWRGDTCLKTRLEYDLYYIENWSVWFDFKIIFLTLFKILNSSEA